MRRTRQRCATRCLPMRLIPIATFYQLPDAPPPPKLPPPPLNPPPLELLLPELLPPDQDRRRRPGAACRRHRPSTRSRRNNVKMKAAMPTMTDAAIDPTNSQATKPTKPPVATEPNSRPKHAAQDATDDEGADDDKGIEGIDDAESARAAPVLRFRRRKLLAVDHADHPVDAGGNAAGKIAGLELRRDVFVDDAPGWWRRSARPRGRSRPRSAAAGRSWRRPAARRRRSSCGRSSMLRRRGSRIARWFPARWSARSAPRSGCPCASPESFSVCVSAAMSPLDSVPVWSTTRPVSGGTATSAARCEGKAQQQRQKGGSCSVSSPPILGYCRVTWQVTAQAPD